MKQGKVWGQTELIFKSPFIEFHKIWVTYNGRCSIHKHDYKWNLFYVLYGELKIKVHKNDYDLIDETLIGPGEWTTVKPGEYHSFEATGVKDVSAFELYYPEPLSDDIIRKTVGGLVDTE
jgi:mannose-6-phosphate isomerase-like protein (cupin superfamily)